MKTYKNLYYQLCSYENLELAFQKARKRKTLKNYVIEFETDLQSNLKELKHELENFTYSPYPLTTFIVYDPKTRKISASHFRDRVVHHALCNIISPIFEKTFIPASFANRKGKGTHPAIRRFEQFLSQTTFYHKKTLERERVDIFSYALKADIRHYFETVDHEILLTLIRRKIKDQNIIWLIKTILENHKTQIPNKGMPIGNLTSQFFANVYLDRLDQFVKHELRVKNYLRYVDDFVILHSDKNLLEKWKKEINDFLIQNLELELHPEKSRIIPLKRGISLLGYRVFGKYRLIKKSNARRIWKRLYAFKKKYDRGEIVREEIVQSLEGWLAYAEFANTYNFRKKVMAKFNELFGTQK